MLCVVTLSAFFPSLRRSSVVWASPVMAQRAASGASRRSALISSSLRFGPERVDAYLTGRLPEFPPKNRRRLSRPRPFPQRASPPRRQGTLTYHGAAAPGLTASGHDLPVD